MLADRVDRRRLLMTFPAISVAANVTLGLLVLDGSVTVVHIIGLAALVGSARAVEIPVRNAFVRDLVGMDDLRNAIALNAAAFNVARVLGPAIGAGLLAWLGMGPCFFVAAAANGAMTLALLGVRIARHTPAPAIGSPLRQLLEGLRHVRGHRRTRTVMLLFAITLLFTWTYQTVLPAYAKDRLGMGESGYALLASVIGVGALVGALWVAGARAAAPAPSGATSSTVSCGPAGCASSCWASWTRCDSPCRCWPSPASARSASWPRRTAWCRRASPTRCAAA